MPQLASHTVTSQLNQLQGQFLRLQNYLNRVLGANGPYVDMRPARLAYLHSLRNQATNLQVNAQNVSVVVLQMLGHTTGATNSYLLQEQIKLNNLLRLLTEMRALITSRIERDQQSLERAGR